MGKASSSGLLCRWLTQTENWNGMPQATACRVFALTYYRRKEDEHEQDRPRPLGSGRTRPPFPPHWERPYRYMPTITTTYGEFEIDSVPPPPKVVEPPRPKSWGDCPLYFQMHTAVRLCTAKPAAGLLTGEGSTTGKRCPFGDKQTLFVCSRRAATLWSLCNHRKEKNNEQYNQYAKNLTPLSRRHVMNLVPLTPTCRKQSKTMTPPRHGSRKHIGAKTNCGGRLQKRPAESRTGPESDGGPRLGGLRPAESNDSGRS